MRIYVKTLDAIDPTDFTRCGAVYTDDVSDFIGWMDSTCPSSICTIADNMKPGGDSPWKAYIRFSLPSDSERDLFISRWGSRREIP
jgi:hypothetical protein